MIPSSHNPILQHCTNTIYEQDGRDQIPTHARASESLQEHFKEVLIHNLSEDLDHNIKFNIPIAQ